MLAVGMAVVIGLVSLALTGWLAHPDSPIRILDRPNERSLHTRPTPRTGGIAICVALFLAWALDRLFLSAPFLPVQIVQGALIVAGVALIDDRFDLSPLVRLLIQLGAVMMLIRDGFVMQGEFLPAIPLPEASGVVIIMTLILTIWLINLYNFMDGMDGFSGGMTLIGFATLAILGFVDGNLQFAGSALAVCAAAAGFLWFNFPPARIFMGDSGSTTLGFLAAGFSIWGSRSKVAEIWVTLVIFSPFVVDATVTLLRRAARGEPVWQAHRSHYYQRLVQLGWGHRRTVLAEYAVMLICSLSAIVASVQPPAIQWLILALICGGYLGAALFVHKLERSKNDLNHG